MSHLCQFADRAQLNNLFLDPESVLSEVEMELRFIHDFNGINSSRLLVERMLVFNGLVTYILEEHRRYGTKLVCLKVRMSVGADPRLRVCE